MSCYEPLQETHITWGYVKGSDKSCRKDICLIHRPLYVIMGFSEITSLSIIVKPVSFGSQIGKFWNGC